MGLAQFGSCFLASGFSTAFLRQWGIVLLHLRSHLAAGYRSQALPWVFSSCQSAPRSLPSALTSSLVALPGFSFFLPSFFSQEP